jgi:hypothetical protein
MAGHWQARHQSIVPIRVRVEIMGSQQCRIVGKSQLVLIMIDPVIFTRTRIWVRALGSPSPDQRALAIDLRKRGCALIGRLLPPILAVVALSAAHVPPDLQRRRPLRLNNS